MEKKQHRTTVAEPTQVKTAKTSKRKVETTSSIAIQVPQLH